MNHNVLREEVLEKMQYTSSKLAREIAAKRFPEPLRLAPRTMFWPRTKVAPHFEAARQARDNKPQDRRLDS